MDLQSLSDQELLSLRGQFPASDAPLKITVTPSASRPLSEWSDAELLTARNQPNMAEDIAKSTGIGVVKGGISLAGLPSDIAELGAQGIDAATRYVGSKLGIDVAARAPDKNPTLGGADLRQRLEGITGPLYEPKTTPGHYAQSVGEMLPGAMMGPGGVARNAINFALIPGVASEAVGRRLEGTGYETAARIGTAVATGGLATALNRPRTAERAIRNAMSPNVDQAAINRARQLIDDAAQRGVTLTWAEALEQVSPGSGLPNMQRVLEGTPGSREVLAPVMANRPAQIGNAARPAFDQIAPVNNAPSGIGPAVGTAAEDTINTTRQNINRVAEPYYTAARADRVDAATMGRIRMTPGWAEARDAVRNDPQLNRHVAQLPENSVSFLNEVKKYLGQASENAGAPVNAQRNMQRSAGYGMDEGAVRQAGINASPAYETALAIETHGRRQFLEPLLQGPLGKMASSDTTTQKAINALFPEKPLANSAHEIEQAVGALAARNQRATRDLIRAHAEATFNETAQNLVGGANQWGGGKFAAVLVGNRQQRANLEAAIRASGPDGDAVWAGFNRFLEVMEATGKRQAQGSKTSFNTQDLKDLSSGSIVGNAIKTGTAPAKWLTATSDLWSRVQMGRNVERLANILVDPRSRNLLRAIAARPTGARETAILVGQIALTANAARNHETQRTNR